MDLVETCSLGMNDSGTSAEIDASLTHPRSRRVHSTKPVDPLISQLHTLRSAHGADTPIGHRCSSLAQMIPIYKASTDAVQRAHLAAGMERKMGELKRLAAQFN